MNDCYCDYDGEPPAVYRAKLMTARKQRKCNECGVQILPGERYENVFGVWEGKGETFGTCHRCLALREWVQAHVPCVCWAHGNAQEDLMEIARECSYDAPGLLFGAYRRQIAIDRARKAQREARKQS